MSRIFPRINFKRINFKEFKTNKKNENMTFLMEILQGLMLKHVYILSILNFPLNMEATISYLSIGI
jgi:hypothetical protein